MISRYRYLRTAGGRRPEHCVVFEQHYRCRLGRLHVHHLDGNPANNTLANLAVLTAQHHRLLHEGGRLSVRGWEFLCRFCGRLLPSAAFARRRIPGQAVPGKQARCRECQRDYDHRRRAA